MKKRKLIYALGSKDGTLAVYSSERQLKKGVDYWVSMNESCRRTTTLSHIIYELNYSPEPIEWGWSWIDPRDTTESLMDGGAVYIPKKQFRGVNLIGKNLNLDLDFIPHYEIKRLYELNSID